MITTFRVGAMSSPRLRVGLALWMRRIRCWMLRAQDALQLGQVPYLELGCPHALGQGAPVAVNPGRSHAHALGASDVDLRAVADEERLAGSRAQPSERQLEDDGLGLAPADLVGDDHGLEEISYRFSFKNVPR